MTTVVLALAATAAAAALTWFFCMRPMLRSRRAAGTDKPAAACCAPSAPGIEEQIRSAREELARLQAADPPHAGARPTPAPARHPGPGAARQSEAR